MPWRRMGEWRYRSTILDLDTRWRWVVSFTSVGNRPWYPLDRGLGEPHSRSGLRGESEYLTPPGIRTQAFQPVAIPTFFPPSFLCLIQFCRSMIAVRDEIRTRDSQMFSSTVANIDTAWQTSTVGTQGCKEFMEESTKTNVWAHFWMCYTATERFCKPMGRHTATSWIGDVSCRLWPRMQRDSVSTECPIYVWSKRCGTDNEILYCGGHRQEPVKQ
jgi:hypothetical protein